MSIAVEDNAVEEVVTDLQIAVESAGFEGSVGNVDASDSHVTGGQGSGLACNDVAELARSLKSIKILDEEVLGLELIDRECHGHRDHKRHTFWDADNQESDGSGGKINKTGQRSGINKVSLTEHNSKKPDDTKENESHHAEDVSVGTDDVGKDTELCLEGSLARLNL